MRIGEGGLFIFLVLYILLMALFVWIYKRKGYETEDSIGFVIVSWSFSFLPLLFIRFQRNLIDKLDISFENSLYYDLIVINMPYVVFTTVLIIILKGKTNS